MQCRTCQFWAAGQGKESGLCLASNRSAVRRSFEGGLLLRLDSGDAVTTAEAFCREHMPVQQKKAPSRAHLSVVG
jgi:hypothetical protein